MKFLRPKTVAALTGLHVVHVKRLASNPDYAHLGFPKMVRLGDNSVAFVESEIDAWMKGRVAERDTRTTRAPG